MGEKTLSTGEKVKYSFSIERPTTTTNPNRSRRCLNFSVQLKNGDGKMRRADFSISSVELRGIEPFRLTIETLKESKPPLHYDFLLNENDMLARVTYLFIAKILKDTSKVDEIKMEHSKGEIGSALLAQKYGWEGPVEKTFCVNSILRSA